MEQIPDLPHEFEWMLQSREIDDARLIELLVYEYYPEILRLVASKTNDITRAHEIARETFIQAALNRWSFWGDQSVIEWLYTFVDKVSTQNLNNTIGFIPTESIHGQSIASQYISDEITEVNYIAIISEIESSVRKNRARRKVNIPRRELILAGSGFTILIVIVWLGNLYRSTGAIPQNTPIVRTVVVTRVIRQVVVVTPTPYSGKTILYRVKRGDTLPIIATNSNLPIELIRIINNLSPGAAVYPGALLKLPQDTNDSSLSDHTPVATMMFPTLAPKFGDQLIPFPPGDRWKTLWADVFVYDYGPPGYIGLPVSVLRKQVWLDFPSRSLVIRGDADDYPTNLSIIEDGRLTTRYSDDPQYRQSATTQLLVDRDLRDLFFNENLKGDRVGQPGTGEIHMIGYDHIAGSPTLVLEWFNEQGVRVYRYWVDKEKGVVLKRRTFNQGDGFTTLEDVIVNAIEYDVDLPINTFENAAYVWPVYFSTDYTGEETYQIDLDGPGSTVPPPGRVPLPKVPAPPGFDPSKGQLIFQWPQDYLETGFNPGNPARVAVLSDRYYIGNMVLYSPMSFMCRRSMDGSVIAYPGWGEDDFSPGSINWVKLTNLNEINSIQLQERRKITTLEFSPQGDLAYTECTPFGARCGLWILNLETYVSEKLADVGVMGYLMWSPDGKYLAGVRYTSEAGGGGVIVIDVNTGDVVYEGSFDWWNLKAFPDSPTWEWGVPFPDPLAVSRTMMMRLRYIEDVPYFELPGIERCTLPLNSSWTGEAGD